MTKHRVDDDSEKWESGELGQDPKFAQIVSEKEQQELENALELVPITLRLQKKLVEDLKRLSASDGLGYQPFVRQILTQYVREHAKPKVSL